MKNSWAIVLLVLVLALASSCESSPSAIEAKASVRLASIEELKSSYGQTFTTNPYLDPVGIIRGKSTEFAVIRIDLVLNAEALITLDGQVKNAGGAVVAQAQDLERMRVFWSMWEASDSEMGKRLTSLERSYAPDFSFTAKAGKRSYYLVLMGKYPLPRPATVEAYLTVEGMEPLVFEAALPELPTKK